mmetsp:Transcript_42040/g.75233  ORF Transcript_42040/g.75233 Transcript_42040/m.75233 type:complete len:86 (+) Transcript_42040:1744-2001(+)
MWCYGQFDNTVECGLPSLNFGAVVGAAYIRLHNSHQLCNTIAERPTNMYMGTMGALLATTIIILQTDRQAGLLVVQVPMVSLCEM